MINNIKTFLSHSAIKVIINNIIALALHISITIVSIILSIVFVGTGPTLGKYTTNIISRVFFIILFVALYFFIGIILGTILDIKNNKKYDFFSGSIIAIIGIGLWIYTLSKTGINLVETTEELKEYWIPYNLYYTPFTMIYFLLEINLSPILSLLTNFLPSIFIGFGIKYKRLKQKRVVK